MCIYIYRKWGPQTIAKLLYNSNVTMVYGTYNYSYWGESKPTNITRGPHIVMIALVRYYWYKLCIDIYIYMYITKVLHCWCHSAFHISRNFFPSKRDGHTEGHSPLQPRSAASASCGASPWENFHHEKWWKKWGQTMKYPLNMGEIWWIYRIFKCLSEILVVFTQ